MMRLSGESWDRRVSSSRIWGDKGDVGISLMEDGGLVFAVLAKDLPRIAEMVR